ncbi:MAG: hypothetical protein WDN31_15790 [Hyphomicrobium sp.]
MAATFNFELVTPERLVFSGEATQVVRAWRRGATLPCSPVIRRSSPTLRPGILEVTLPQGRQQLLVKKGVAEADPSRLTVLAQTAVSLEELTGARLASELQLAEAQAGEAKDDHARMNAEALLDVLKRIQLKAAVASTAKARRSICHPGACPRDPSVRSLRLPPWAGSRQPPPPRGAGKCRDDAYVRGEGSRLAGIGKLLESFRLRWDSPLTRRLIAFAADLSPPGRG